METFLVLAIVLVAPFVSSHPGFLGKIPNGNNVPNPNPACGGIWYGVGHWSYLGGGARNSFGLALKGNGLKWDAKLCNMDSDGDGRSNGVELCDPECNWSEGDPQPTCTGQNKVTHPGVCEPIEDEACRNVNSEDIHLCEFYQY